MSGVICHKQILMGLLGNFHPQIIPVNLVIVENVDVSNMADILQAIFSNNIFKLQFLLWWQFYSGNQSNNDVNKM